MADVLEDGMESMWLCRREKDAATAILERWPQLEVLQPTTTRDLGETRDGGERGWEGAQVWR